jgi:hypothetical protein
MKLTLKKSQKVRLAGSKERRAKTGVILLAVTMIGVTTLIISFAATNGPTAIDLNICSVVKAPATCTDGVVTFKKATTSVMGKLNVNNTNPSVTALFQQHRDDSPEKLWNERLTNGLIVGNSPQFEFFHESTAPNGEGGQVRMWCQYSHMSYDDPIIFPKQPGKSHLHMFFGNTDTDANSTASSITKTGGSTCDGGALNRTSYWFPVLIDSQNNARTPNQMMLYYKTEGIPKPPGGYSSIPPGLRMIAGDPSATTPRTNHDADGWACGGGLFTNPNKYGNTPLLIPLCPIAGDTSRTRLSQKVLFPRCWDGVMPDINATVDEPYSLQAAHVTWPSFGVGQSWGTCPSSHPKVFPEISILMEWELAPGENTSGWKLSSDKGLPGGTTSHGDYFGGWNKQVVDSWTNNCLNTNWNCQTSFISNQPNSPAGAVPGGSYNSLRGTAQDQFAGKGPQKFPVPTNAMSGMSH